MAAAGGEANKGYKPFRAAGIGLNVGYARKLAKANRDAKVLAGLSQQENRLVGVTSKGQQLTLDTQTVCFVAGTRVLVGYDADGRAIRRSRTWPRATS